MKQKIGTIVFTFIVIIGITTVIISRHYDSSVPAFWKTDSITLSMFEDSLTDIQNEYASKWEKRDTIRQKKKELPPVNRHNFDPNTADSIELLQQGFLPWQVSNMIKYRNKGGKWRKPEDIRKIYGVDSAFYAAIEPYIQINDSLFAKRDSTAFDTTRIYTVKRDTIIELNTADTTSLQLIKHIGSYTARKIIAYRDKLGGFYSIEQLSEIKDLPTGTFDNIKNSLQVNPTLIRQININRASISQMARHPYIRAEQAKNIYDYRRRNLKIKSLDEIKNFFEDNDWQRILPYLALE